MGSRSHDLDAESFIHFATSVSLTLRNSEKHVPLKGSNCGDGHSVFESKTARNLLIFSLKKSENCSHISESFPSGSGVSLLTPRSAFVVENNSLHVVIDENFSLLNCFFFSCN